MPSPLSIYSNRLGLLHNITAAVYIYNTSPSILSFCFLSFFQNQNHQRRTKLFSYRRSDLRMRWYCRASSRPCSSARSCTTWVSSRVTAAPTQPAKRRKRRSSSRTNGRAAAAWTRTWALWAVRGRTRARLRAPRAHRRRSAVDCPLARDANPWRRSPPARAPQLNERNTTGARSRSLSTRQPSSSRTRDTGTRTKSLSR